MQFDLWVNFSLLADKNWEETDGSLEVSSIWSSANTEKVWNFFILNKVKLSVKNPANSIKL